MDITYQLIVLNIFQESEADIEDFMQQKLEAEEGVGLFLDIVNIGLLTFYIHVFGTCIWCYLTEFAIRFSLNYWYFNFLCNEKYRYMYQKLVIEK